jgi:rod shape determining protein RodA
MPFKRYLTVLSNFDWLLLISVILLICFGLAVIYSITISFEKPDFLNFRKQIFFAIIGIVFLFIFNFLDYRFWKDISVFFYIFAVILLVAVLFLGQTVRGTRGWFSIMGFNFQPVEFAKIALIIFLADFLTKKNIDPKSFKTFFLSGFFTAVMFGLVILQPDFGSGLILFLIWFLMLMMAGGRKKYLLSVVLLMVVIFVFSWFYLFADYQKARIVTFINPQSDPYGRGYHVRQAMIAVGAGGWMGRGLGFGSQSQLKFIPDSQTDFIFAVTAEELGFVGVALVIFFWAVVLYRLVKAAMRTKDDFAAMVIVGISIVFFCHLVINIGMNIGLLPVTGISLPFLSYGGSFLFISLIAIGIVQSIIVRNRT